MPLRGYGEVAYGTDIDTFKLLPFARFAYIHLVSEGFSETGGTGALTGARTERNYKFGSVGLRFGGEPPISPSITFEPKASIACTHGWDIRGTRQIALRGHDGRVHAHRRGARP